VSALKSLHAAQDYQGMLELIKKTMNIDGRLIVAWVNSGGPKEMKDAPAWIQMPKDMPFYGTTEFREAPITMFIRKSFLQESTYDQAAIMLAHELSHIVLNSLRHSLRGCEKAVDLTAMLLGFRQLYESACHKETRSGNRIKVDTIGYLTLDEVLRANTILAAEGAGQDRRPAQERPRPPWPKLVTKSARIWAASLAATLAFGAGALLYKGWALHHKLVEKQAASLKSLPQRVDSTTTLTDIQVGFHSWTQVYETVSPINARALERGIREHVCSARDYREMVSNGTSFAYEFRTPSKALLARIEVSSCP
jgi:hypothetical protein